MFKILRLELIFLFILLIFGIYLSFISGYGSDEDTLALIGAYESMMGGQKLMASRFTPYPVAEIGIGFLSYQFGSWASNLSTFIFSVLSYLFFFKAVEKKITFQNISIFVILCLSNPILFYDNLEPIDYSWALLPFTIGVFFLRKNKFELAIVFFGISIGARINFVLFVFIGIMLFDYVPTLKIKKKLILFVISFFIGGLFYLPIWFSNGLSLSWLTAVTPNDQGNFGLFARFIYKTILSLTVLSLLFILINFIIKKKVIYFDNLRFILGIIISNLILFFFIPAEISYLQPFIIALYYFLYKNFKKKIIITLVILNLLSWVTEIDFLKIKYKSQNKCDNVQAVSAEIFINLKPGRFFQFTNSRDKISCWVKDDSERSRKILSGKALKK
ncbi:hypothetical protein [Candidatus Pelagibacter sp. HIMB1748]|uniref:hypothetical protein n=1 Tax=unclassified Candidatus Pelagibacter TaxID=2647897 RepID=UPI003F82E97A